MDVFLMIRCHKATIFTDAKESSTVSELKRIVEGILKQPPDEQTPLRPCAWSRSPACPSCPTREAVPMNKPCSEDPEEPHSLQ
uniref:Ubiquitin-like domain-containing protein n=1 Tax=Saimiri boliviensis boliviensis TaxID=39432 RepID=A0A2K6SNI4_SAIBB